MTKKLPLYQIVGWNSHFESAKSRLIQRCANTYAPNKHGGSGWSNVMGEEDGAMIWGIWKMLLDICSRQMQPREGWLTANGKKDGRRLSARELSNQLRRPMEEVVRSLQVLQSPEVAFIQLVDGQPEHIKQASEGDRETTEVHLAGAGETEDTAVSREYPEAVSARGIQREIDKKEEPPIIPQGDGEENAEEVGGANAERSTPNVQRRTSEASDSGDSSDLLRARAEDSSRIPEGHSADTEEALQYAEAERWLNGLFGRKKAWQAKELHALSEVLPIAAADQRLITWAYSLPRSEQGWAVYNDVPLSKPRQNMIGLLENFNGEIEKWSAARKQAGLNGLYANGVGDAPDDGAEATGGDGWTAARKEAFVAEFGEERQFPPRFADLGDSLCRQLDERAVEAAN